MLKADSITFNPFQENTYILHDETGECIIIDPGCYEKGEKEELAAFIRSKKLNPVRLINTHCHIDHILGNYFVAETFGLKLEAHELEIPVLKSAEVLGPMWGIHPDPSPMPSALLKEGDVVSFGNTRLAVLFTPGHSPGSITFYSKENGLAISGDVLFHQSIGRTDLPGGDFKTLIKSIREKLFTLPNETKIFSGHGPMTTIGFEKENNPFVQ